MAGLLKKFCDSDYRLPARRGRFTVGLLKPWEVRHVARLEAESFPEPLSPAALLRLWLRPETTYLAVRDGGKLAAYIGFQAWGPLAHTISMCVAKEYRRQGLGRLVQLVANKVAMQQGLRCFCGEVRISNTPQLQLLRAMGWREAGRFATFFGNGEDAVLVYYLLESDRGD
ncbi:MAG TPA: GNAT family N-acetyltransferase [Firmicutes bacterium]|nr:GNAT family N-acetyltransferase [Bacillota bacterium]